MRARGAVRAIRRGFLLTLLLLVVLVLAACFDFDVPTACSKNADRCTSDSAFDGAGADSSTDDGVVDASTDVDSSSTDSGSADSSGEDASLDGGEDATPLAKGWRALATPPTPLVARVDHTAVWTGTEMIVFGGAIDTEVSPAATDTGAAYNPTTNMWRVIAKAPSKRKAHAAVWSGTKMIVWGGSDGVAARTDGAAYDPVADSWSVIAACPLTSREGAGAVWSTTTNALIVWGGIGGCSGTSGVYCADGAAYTPSKDEWTMLPAAPIAGRTKHAMVWTGSSAAIWGGAGKAGTITNDGALYDPLAKVWTALPSPPAVIAEKRSGPAIAGFGNELYIWGGQGGSEVDGSFYRNDGAHLKTASTWASSFAPLSSSILTSPKRALSATWFGAGRLFVWSGIGDAGGGVSGALANGASYDPNFDVWSPMLNAGEPAKRVGASVVWTGKFAILFGGKDATVLYADGGLYVP